MDHDKKTASDGMIINEIQLLLAEKRTSLSIMRTGIAIFALPLSVLSVLIATSRYYVLDQVLYLLIPLFAIIIGLSVLACWLIVRSIKKLRHFDRIIQSFKLKHKKFMEFVE